MSPIILKVRFNKNNFLSFTNLITKYKIFIFQFLTMRKRYIHTSFTKDSQDFQFRNRFFHNLQPTQNQYLDVQNTDEDFMDFQYDDDELNNSQSEEIEEFSENNSDDVKIEDKLSDEEEFGNIIDKALDENKMPSYNNNNEFAPYFENFTTASLF